MSHTWENNSISIVLLPSEVRYPKVHEQLKQWIGDGLLGNFVWMTAENIKKEEFGPPTIRGTVWGLDHNRELIGIEVDPFEEMARNRFKTVRLLAVRVLSNTFDPDETEYEKFNLLSDYIRLSLPLATSKDEPGKKTNLRRINLVVHPTDLQSTDYSQVFKGHWDHHVIASPEDRKTPLSADRFVKEDARYPKFISMHIAATGGLWNGISRSPFDELAKPESGAHSYQLSRVFVNSVLTDGLSRRVAASVLSDLADPTIDLHQKGLVAEIPDTVFIPDTDAEAWVDEMVKIVFQRENGLLSFEEPVPAEELKWVKWTEWQGIKDFIIFSGKKIIFALHANALRTIRPFTGHPILNHLKMTPLYRIYSIFPVGSQVWFQDLPRIVTDGPLRHIIPINASKGLIMTSYTDAEDTVVWNRRRKNGTLDKTLMKELRSLLPLRDIPNPLSVSSHYWEHGCTYWTPGSYDPVKESNAIMQPFPTRFPDVYVCGESFSLKQAWMEGALEHADTMLNKFFFRAT